MKLNNTNANNHKMQTSENISKQAAIFTAVLIFFEVLVILFLVFVNFTYHPLRSNETFLFVTIISSFIWISLAHIIYRICYLPHNKIKYKWFVWIMIAVPSCVMTVSGVYALNANLDNSVEDVHVFTVTGRDYSSYKRSVTYFATVPCFTASRWSQPGDFALDYTEQARVSRNEYLALVPGLSKVTFITKNGYFKIPWIVKTSVSIKNELSEDKIKMDPDYIQGLAYFKGDRVAKDMAKAFQYFEIAAKRGDAFAQHDLGYMYSIGAGVKRDDYKAFEWIKKSAENGNAVAQDDLGVIYAEGRGVTQDWIQAYRWISLSANQGNERAVKDLQFAESHMTTEQIQAAKSQKHP